MLDKIKYFLLDWIWQLPQNIIALIYKRYVRDSITSIEFNDSLHYIICRKTVEGNVSLGKYIFVRKGIRNISYVIQHESGHCKQSKMLGPLYLFVIGIPSVCWLLFHKKFMKDKSYYWFYTERWANKLAGI